MKYKVFVVMLIAIMGLSLVSIPNAFSQIVNTNVKVLSYSYYTNAAGDFIVVGEVQNDGTSILSSLTVNATAYDSSGGAVAGNSALAYVSDFLPQQKAPFYIDLGQANVAGDDWGSTVSNVDFAVFNTFSTTNQQYGSLIATVSFNGTVDGPYDVIGFVSNIGNQTASGVNVVGTYYNSLGTVVAVGYDALSGSLVPDNATMFTVSEFDSSASLVAQISNYTLLVQTSTLQSSNLPTSASPKPLPTTDLIAIGVLAVVAVVLIVVVLLTLRKRKTASESPPPPPASPEPLSPPPPPPQE